MYRSGSIVLGFRWPCGLLKFYLICFFLYKKDLHDPDNHNRVITHLEPDILECEVKWPVRIFPREVWYCILCMCKVVLVSVISISISFPVSCTCTLLTIAGFDIIFVCRLFLTCTVYLLWLVSFPIGNFLVSGCGLFFFPCPREVPLSLM